MAYKDSKFIVHCSVGGTSGYSGAQTGYMAWFGFYVSEASAQIRFGKCVLVGISILVSTNTLNTNSTVILYKNGIATAVTFTITALTTGQFTATCLVPLIDGDRLSLQLALGGTGAQGIYFKGGEYIIQ